MMDKKDRTGNKYEKLLTASLLQLNYQCDSDSEKNYIHPSPRSKIIIPGTYIQPDVIVRNKTKIIAILYVTHWSRRRNSSFKFWRTWEEAAQQKLIVGKNLLTINCIFEALRLEDKPDIYLTADDLPKDHSRENKLPIRLSGWDSGTGWSMIEAFDISLVFPVGYQPTLVQSNYGLEKYDLVTTKLIKKALESPVKYYLFGQWEALDKIKREVNFKTLTLKETYSRYRIGLLHIYLFHRLICVFFQESNINIDVQKIIIALCNNKQRQINLNTLESASPFNLLNKKRLQEFFLLLSEIYVRKGKEAKTFSTFTTLTNPSTQVSINRIQFNNDLQICLQNIQNNLKEDFLEAINCSFLRFDNSYAIREIFEDLANPALVDAKYNFVFEKFSNILNNKLLLNKLLQTHAKEMSDERLYIAEHKQNWVLEILIYLAGLNVEDIYSKIIKNFEFFGHELRPHAPYADNTKLISYMIQGRDICEHWSSKYKKNKTLTEEEFAKLSWKAVSICILESFEEKGNHIISKNEVIKKYLESKSMRILSSDLNGFQIMIEYYLSDICTLSFTDKAKRNKETNKQRKCRSWQSDVINGIWKSKALETWMTGISDNEKWLIKTQSSQDGNEGHKTKELAGRCRAIHIAWSHGLDPKNRDEWLFNKRQLPKLALVLDGDWSVKNKRNLYEAGWDWVGDISQLGELRQLIQGETF